MKRDFRLSEDDEVFLNSLSLNWEAISEGGMQWIIIRDFPVTPGFNVEKVDVAIKIEVGYPRTQLDMAYFFPPLSRKDGCPIGAVSSQNIQNVVYQRWSRHRTPTNPWREGIDDLSTHMSLVSFWFEQEFIKKPRAVPA